jgi:diguanylate cyclase (GGDEF)-like protein/PAS domain S-box-containing protein
MELDRRRVIGAVLVDVTDERMLEAAELEMRASVAEERAQLLAVFAAVDDGVVVLDAQHRGVYANPAYCEMFSLSPDKVRGLPREAFLAHTAQLSDDPKAFAKRFAAIDDHGDEAIELEFARPRRRVLRRTVTPIQLPGGAGFLVVWRDVTSDRDLISERERQANTDPLTGLPNRRGAAEALEREVARARRNHSPLAVAMLDIDHFKRINDHNGHPAGDHVLVVIAGVLTAQMRITDTAARWGGEEFLVVLPGAIDAARAYCERVRVALADLEVARVGRITISAGIAELEADETIDQAIARADRQLYAAKEAGRDQVAH